MRRLKLTDAEIERVLDELDLLDATEAHRSPCFPYRVLGLRVDIQLARDALVPHMLPTRKIGRDTVTVLVGHLVHPDTACHVFLSTIRDNVQIARGRVANCRYIKGGSGVYEMEIRFEHPIDPATFAATAVRTRILLADDSAMSRRLLTHLLSGLNCEVSTVTNGNEAVMAAQNELFDLVIMDVELPELDGISAVRLLRCKGYLRPIVAVSSWTDDEVRQRCSAAGCDEFLAKPVHREDLAPIIERIKPEPLVSSMLHETEMAAIIDEFVRDLPQRVRTLEAALAARNSEEFAQLVRRLKGEAGGCGFEPITQAALEVEQLLKAQGPPGDLRSALAVLVKLCLSARPATCDTAFSPNPADQPEEPAETPPTPPRQPNEIAAAS
ncbi:MAG TPA: response regulator [Phycisphaerae bacterium]|nr:response regulator [Phycisphaerae bacterium]